MKIKDKNRIKRRVQTLDQLQREQLASIGGVLRQTREEQSLSLEQLSSKTLIRPSLMSAIESANLEQLPEPVYVRGLIKRYADILGLDGETLAIQFFTHLNLRSRSSWKDSPAAQLRPLHL
ncbi:MAG: helix-turn-helix domain-containing protein, partial [Pseudanabaenales cyanobacterium]|nr:helix-turn-helix domain-containing protein [Pseudanabaenales cyanobacterium]